MFSVLDALACFPSFSDSLLTFRQCFDQWGQVAGSASAQIADLYPILQKLPSWIAPNVKHARQLHVVERDLYIRHWMRAKQALDDGTGLPCFCNDIYRAQTEEKFTDAAAGYISGSLLEAGSDTTASTLYGFILALLLWPDVQTKLQAEIDAVVGPDRLPDISDFDSGKLPYVRCCIKESLRWMPTVVLGVPHAATRDDVYQGWRIPQGATVINNVWSIHMDEKRTPHPRVFDPDRFAGDNTSLYQSAIGDTTKRDNFVFGAGRRLCQGIHIAERSLFLGIARFAWAFTFTKTPGAVYNPEKLVGSITVQPDEFPCVVTPRSAAKAEMIRQAAAQDRTQLDPKTGQWRTVPAGMAFSTWMPDEKEVKTT